MFVPVDPELTISDLNTLLLSRRCRCCKEHDKCYDEAIAEKACANVPIEYMENYSWLCSRKDGNSTSSSSNSSSLVDNSSRKALAASAGTGEPVCEGECGHVRG